MRFSLRIHPSNQVLLLHVVFVIRLLYPLQYYITLTKSLHLSSEPMWQMTYEKPYETHVNQSILVFIDSISNEKVSASLDGWVKQADEAFVFSGNKIYEMDSKSYSLLRLKTQNRWVRLRMMTAFAYKTLPLHTDWIVFTHSDTFIIIDQLRTYLRTLDCDEKHVAIIGTRNFEKPRKHVNPIHIFSRGAFKDLAWKLHQDSPDCRLSDSLWTCLKDVNRSNLDMDDEYRYRYFPMNRHFSPHEMTEYIKQHGFYDDGFQIIHQLSRSLLSFHSLEVDDLRILDVLLNRVRVWRK